MRNIILTKFALFIGMACASHTVMAAKKIRKFYVLPTYTSKSEVIDKKEYDKAYKTLENEGVAVYRIGNSYQVLVPNSIIFNYHSSNLDPKAEKVIGVLTKWLSFYPISEVSYTGLYLQDDSKGASMQAVVRKQAAELAERIYKNKQIASVETVSTKPLQKHDKLPFWQTMWQIVNKKKPNTSATLIEFKTNS